MLDRRPRTLDTVSGVCHNSAPARCSRDALNVMRGRRCGGLREAELWNRFQRRQRPGCNHSATTTLPTRTGAATRVTGWIPSPSARTGSRCRCRRAADVDAIFEACQDAGHPAVHDRAVAVRAAPRRGLHRARAQPMGGGRARPPGRCARATRSAGMVGLHRIHGGGTGEIGYWMAPGSRGQRPPHRGRPRRDRLGLQRCGARRCSGSSGALWWATSRRHASPAHWGSATKGCCAGRSRTRSGETTDGSPDCSTNDDRMPRPWPVLRGLTAGPESAPRGRMGSCRRCPKCRASSTSFAVGRRASRSRGSRSRPSRRSRPTIRRSTRSSAPRSRGGHDTASSSTWPRRSRMPSPT